MIESVILLALMGVSVASAAFFAGVETGFLSVPRVRLLSLVRQSAPRAKRLAKVLGDMSRVLTTLLVGNNLASVLFSTATAALGTRLFSDMPAEADICLASAPALSVGRTAIPDRGMVSGVAGCGVFGVCPRRLPSPSAAFAPAWRLARRLADACGGPARRHAPYAVREATDRPRADAAGDVREGPHASRHQEGSGGAEGVPQARKSRAFLHPGDDSR